MVNILGTHHCSQSLFIEDCVCVCVRERDRERERERERDVLILVCMSNHLCERERHRANELEQTANKKSAGEKITEKVALKAEVKLDS